MPLLIGVKSLHYNFKFLKTETYKIHINFKNMLNIFWLSNSMTIIFIM